MFGSNIEDTGAVEWSVTDGETDIQVWNRILNKLKEGEDYERRKMEIYLGEFKEIKSCCNTILKEIKKLRGVDSTILIVEIEGIPYELPIIIDEEGDQFVIRTMLLNISTFGDTKIDAINNLMEAVILYFDGEPKEFIEKQTKKLKKWTA